MNDSAFALSYEIHPSLTMTAFIIHNKTKELISPGVKLMINLDFELRHKNCERYLFNKDIKK